MPLSAIDLKNRINEELWAPANRTWTANNFLKKTIDGNITKVWMPDGVDGEYKDLMRKSRSPWLEYCAQSISQGLIVDGYSNNEVWKNAWQANLMDGRQGAMNYQVVAYGYSYLLSFPGQETGTASMRPLSVHKTFGFFEDDWDEDPTLVITRSENRKRWRIFDAEAMYEIEGNDPRKFSDMTTTPHDAGVQPVTMIRSSFSLDGLPRSLVEPAVPVYKRIVDGTFTLQMGKRYGAFPQKSQSGGEIATDENGNSLVRPSIDTILHSEDPTTKFSAFPAADLNQMIAAVEKEIQDLAAIMQVPPHYLLGKISNLSAEALAAAESGYFRRNALLRSVMGEGYERALRVAASFMGPDYESAASDTSSEVHWADVSHRALSQVADAINKLDATNAPLEKLYALLPDWTSKDAKEAQRSAYQFRKSERDREDRMNQTPSVSAATPPEQVADRTVTKEQADALGTLIRAGVSAESAAKQVGITGLQFTGMTPVALRPSE